MLIMFIGWTFRELNKEPKNRSAKGGCSMLFSALLIKTMGLWITIFPLLGIFKHSDSSREPFLQSVCWKENRVLILKTDAHGCFPLYLDSVNTCAGKWLSQVICLGSCMSSIMVDCGYCNTKHLTYSSICLIHLTLITCFKPDEIWVHLPVYLDGLQFLPSFFISLLSSYFFFYYYYF